MPSSVPVIDLRPWFGGGEAAPAAVAAALGLERNFFTRHTGHATHTMNINWYPPMAVAGELEPGQFRIGPHTDFGTVTILDREPGRGGLQVWTERDGWEDAPESLRPPIGRRCDFAPVVSAQFLRERYDAIAIG